MEQMYISRECKGNERAVYNQTMTKIPGLYNERGNINVQVVSNVENYDLFNLTAAERVTNLEKHFEVI